MKIAQVFPYYYPHVGGVEHVVQSISERLVKVGHEVTIYALKDPRNLPSNRELNGVQVLSYLDFSPSKAYHIPSFNFIRDLVKSKVDIVHFHSIHSLTTLASFLTKRMKNVLTLYYHGSGHSCIEKTLWKAYRPFASMIVRRQDSVISVSKLEEKLVERDFRCKPTTIENGVDETISQVAWNPEKGRILYAGRIEPYKNVHRLAQIVKALEKYFEIDVTFVVIGNGPFRSRLQKILIDLGLTYEMYHFLSRREYSRQLSRAQLFALISSHESYPQSVNEAQAIGVPVMIAKPWGLNFAHRSRSLLIDLSDSNNKIAEKMAHFLNKAHADPKPKVPSWDQVFTKYLALYDQVLNVG